MRRQFTLGANVDREGNSTDRVEGKKMSIQNQVRRVLHMLIFGGVQCTLYSNDFLVPFR